MAMALMGLATLLSLVSFACAIIILIEAFKKKTSTGVLCLICGPYFLYWAIAKLQHPKRDQLLAGWLGTAVISIVLNAVASFSMMPDAH